MNLIVVLQAAPAEAPPWLIVTLFGAVGSLFLALMGIVRLLVGTYEKQAAAERAERMTDLKAQAETLKAVHQALLTQAEGQREVRSQLLAVLPEFRQGVADNRRMLEEMLAYVRSRRSPSGPDWTPRQEGRP